MRKSIQQYILSRLVRWTNMDEMITNFNLILYFCCICKGLTDLI